MIPAVFAPDLELCAAAAEQAARDAGALATSYFQRLTSSQISAKSSAADLVSIADHEAEALIFSRLESSLPGLGFIGEETFISGQRLLDFNWVVDPIDGTSNYLSGLPIWAVSIALCDAEFTPLVGVVHAPLLDRTYVARRGSGAVCNGKPLRVRGEKPSGGVFNSMLATGFPYDTTRHGTNIDYFARMQSRFHKIRRMGSAALDLAFTAEGIFDGMWELKLKPWDTAAGILLVSEAGGVYSQMDGRPYRPGDIELVVAASPELLQLMCVTLGGAVH
jgi:myo-inositol-1(or 4)-monophosphatase